MIKLFFAFILIICSMAGFSQVRPGQQAPELSLPNPASNTIHLTDLKGKVVLIDFWASWCGPCRKNNPHLVRLYNKYHEKGLEILGVSIDTDAGEWKEAIHHDKLGWLQVNDTGGWNAQSTLIYGVDAIPASFLIDKNGIIQKADIAPRELESEIKSLLKK